jgi:hypothetical protein
MRLGPLFKGTITKGIAETELIVTFDFEVSESYLNDCKQGASKPPPFTEWSGLKWIYHIWGSSKTRPGGWEVKSEETAPNRYGRSYRWGITFPIDGKWVRLDIANGYGGLEWKEFEDIAERIIKSVEAI